jgi:hypothetical protein
MNELKTILGTDIPIETRGILYLCNYDRYTPKLTVLREILCTSSSEALYLYAEIPNPESQVVLGDSFDTLIKNLHKLHDNMQNKKWLEQLADSI